MWLMAVFYIAFAATPSSVISDTPDGRQAEYRRLSDELFRMADMNNWVAAQKIFSRLEATGQPHTFRVLLSASTAASNLGDVARARKLLLNARQIRDDPDIDAWVQRIDSEYGPVLLAADLPDNYRLVAEQMPFETDKRRAVQFAMREVLEKSYFDGYIPHGKYVFQPLEPKPGDHVFSFRLRTDRQSFDLRSHEEPTKRDYRLRARINRRLARQRAQEKRP